ncbi:MAG: hypothetical protein ACI8YQ_001827 [Polaribacter sp.]|jgi:hypothetical protein
MTLPNYLFWDIELTSLDYSKNARFIIQRVIQKGSIKEWKIIKDFYGLDLIKNEILMIRDLDAKTLNFFSTYFSLNKNNFRCFTIQQSFPKHFNS